jgi:hypothetical protein
MLVPRQLTYDTYWHFAAKRQDIFFKRLRGEPQPWTDDDILNTFKFCNTYRASDRVSQFLIRSVIYSGEYNEEDVVFRIVLFKIFNKIETWQHLERNISDIRLKGFDFEIYNSLLQENLDKGEAIYTSAYMSCANKAFGYDKKHQNHLMLVHKMFKIDRLGVKVAKAKTAEEVFRMLVEYPLIGGFMAYQLLTDINYSEVLSFDENSFTVAGPGAERGIKKCFLDIGDRSYDYIIRWMQENQEREFDRLGLGFQSLWGRPLHLIDCQGLFCETDKYSRSAFPELKSNRKRIKSRYQTNNAAIHYYYPPKWGINDKVAKYLQRVSYRIGNEIEPSSPAQSVLNI